MHWQAGNSPAGNKGSMQTDYGPSVGDCYSVIGYSNESGRCKLGDDRQHVSAEDTVR